VTDELDETQVAAFAIMDACDPWEEVLTFAGYRGHPKDDGSEVWTTLSRTPKGSVEGFIELGPAQGRGRVSIHGRGKGLCQWFDINPPLRCSEVFVRLNYEGDMEAAADDLLNAAFCREARPAARVLPEVLLTAIRENHTPQAEVAIPLETPRADNATLSSGSLRLRRASEIPIVPVSWLWQDMIPAGHLTLLAGREGVGKSTLGYTLAAQVTRGWLSGTQEDHPAPVIIVASEDSWSSTIKPRLVAAYANMDLVYSLGLKDDGGAYGVDLPKHVPDLRALLEDRPGALVLLDPLISRLNGKLDTHKDAEVRRALEPLVQCLADTDTTALGLIHVNKTTTTDPLTSVMASRAFVGVARSVLFVAVDPNEPEVRYLELVKSNLGSTSIPTLTFSISNETLDGEGHQAVAVGKLNWLPDSDRKVSEILRSEPGSNSTSTHVDGARTWLKAFMADHGGQHESTAIKAAANAAGINTSALHRARQHLGIGAETTATYPRTTVWRTPEG
jgi:hypothetical protein